MRVLHEFRNFAIRGNVVDMAVGIIIGAAFGKIVSSLVADVVTPPLGVLIGDVDFSRLAVVLRAAAPDKPAVVLAYGKFIQTLLDFVLVSFAVFLLVKLVNHLRRKHEEEKKTELPPAPPREEQLLTEIRDLLKATQRSP